MTDGDDTTNVEAARIDAIDRPNRMEDAMIRMFIKHPVEDYDRWRKAYDDFAPTQQRLGVRDEAVFRSVEDRSLVTVTHDFDDLEAARSFGDSDEVKEAMGAAGVAGPPDIWFTEAM